MRESSSSETDYVGISNMTSVEQVCTLLGLQTGELVERLTTTTLRTAGESIVKQQGGVAARDVRDGMAKVIYQRLFEWLITRANGLLKPDVVDHRVIEVAVLDIFGFENFDSNSFEQLCINVANEQLHSFFNKHIFQAELDEYTREGVASPSVAFLDNKGQLDLLLAKPLGLLRLVDDETKFNKATDETLCTKLDTHLKANPFYEAKRDRTSFGVTHYAGVIVYNTEGFLSKNRDKISEAVLVMLGESTLPLVQKLFPEGSAADVMADLPATPGRRKSRFGFAPRRTSKDSSGGRRESHHGKDGGGEGGGEGGGKSPGKRMTRFAKGMFSRRGKSMFGKSKKPKRVQTRLDPTVGARFRSSLILLMTRIQACQPQFVRCIKPNMDKKAGAFDDEIVLRQLKCVWY